MINEKEICLTLQYVSLSEGKRQNDNEMYPELQTNKLATLFEKCHSFSFDVKISKNLGSINHLPRDSDPFRPFCHCYDVMI